jgi:hypothetical protein
MSIDDWCSATASAAALGTPEEALTSYSPKDLSEDWEFKILQSGFREFRKPARLRAVLDEEARGGWVLVEKFDDSRIRLKRLARRKPLADQQDVDGGYDPYRSYVGPEGKYFLIVIAIWLVLALGLLAFLTLFH